MFVSKGQNPGSGRFRATELEGEKGVPGIQAARFPAEGSSLCRLVGH